MYLVIQIHEILPHKPFFIKEKGACYIRIDNSSRPAPRYLIMKLFVGLEDRKNITNLHATLLMLKNDFMGTMNYINSISSDDQTRPSLVDTSFIRSMTMKNQSFLVENDLFGEITKNTVGQGAVTVIQTIEKLNEQIKIYNSTSDATLKKAIKGDLTEAQFTSLH